MQPIKFTVLGQAKPAGSKTAFPLRHKDGSPILRANGSQAIAVTHATSGTRPWMDVVATTARREYAGPLIECEVGVVLWFYKVRPASHYGTGRNAGVLKDGAPQYVAGWYDVDKLARAVNDCLSGTVIRDDKQIVVLVAQKLYGEPGRVEVLVARPESPEVAEAKQLVLWEQKRKKATVTIT